MRIDSVSDALVFYGIFTHLTSTVSLALNVDLWTILIPRTQAERLKDGRILISENAFRKFSRGIGVSTIHMHWKVDLTLETLSIDALIK